jgi:hypothetical protein
MDNIKQRYQHDPITKHILNNGHQKYVVKDGAIFTHDNRLYIPFDEGLRAELIRENHDTPLNGHLGEFKTLNKLATYYYWQHAQDGTAVHWTVPVMSKEQRHQSVTGGIVTIIRDTGQAMGNGHIGFDYSVTQDKKWARCHSRLR